MPQIAKSFVLGIAAIASSSLIACQKDAGSSLEIKALVGSALGDFCQQAATQFNQSNPQLKNGEGISVTCEAEGSGDVVNRVVNLSTQLQSGTIASDSPEFPSLISVDGEIYHERLLADVEQKFPGQGYIPAIPDSSLLVTSPMVFMTPENLAGSLTQTPDLFKALISAKTHKDLNASSPAQPIHYVHTAPTRSNSGLQTLVAQFASASGKRPEEMTIADVQAHQAQIQKIQGKITRYGVSTGALARDMVANGPFWASIGSVYESSVIHANTGRQPGSPKYVAVYPQQTFTSNMRGIIPKAPWMSAEETEAATQFVEFLRSPKIQTLATQIGLRPGVPGTPLGNTFSAEFGVEPNPTYDSLRSPPLDVVEAMMSSWTQFAKKPSLVAVVIDSSGSMTGNKLPAVQNTLSRYLEGLNPKDKIALIDFDSDIREPVVIDGTQAGQELGLQFIGRLQADGGTRLFDAALFARNWLRKNLQKNAINAVLILTDGDDSESSITLAQLEAELQKSGFNSDERIAFFTIGYGQDGEFNASVLEKIAQLNGGYYSKGDPATIARLMADLQLEF